MAGIAARVVLRGLAAAGGAIYRAAKNPAVRRAAAKAAQKAGQAFSRFAQKSKQLCQKAWRKLWGPRTTGHGAQRLAERGFSAADVALTKTGRVLRQADGAKVFVKEIAPGRFNVIVEGQRGIVTALKNISQKSLDRLAGNYGWK